MFLKSKRWLVKKCCGECERFLEEQAKVDGNGKRKRGIRDRVTAPSR